MIVRLAFVDPDTFQIPTGWTAVGFLDEGGALAYDSERVPHRVVEGVPTPLDPADVNGGLVDAVEKAALTVWPGGYSAAFPLAFGLNRRTTQPDRIARSGLNPAVLRALAAAASAHDAPGIGTLMSALALYADRHGQGIGTQEDLADAEEAAANALDILRSVRRGRTLQVNPKAEE